MQSVANPSPSGERGSGASLAYPPPVPPRLLDSPKTFSQGQVSSAIRESPLPPPITLLHSSTLPSMHLSPVFPPGDLLPRPSPATIETASSLSPSTILPLPVATHTTLSTPSLPPGAPPVSAPTVPSSMSPPPAQNALLHSLFRRPGLNFEPRGDH
ncbi:hypothetical protein RhiJN_20761 [Ceratobasidium sp. AG-Ba]|nr:hypothetical protein RhiJN_20761 [Ceratobasidium sp. AG-Ba]